MSFWRSVFGRKNEAADQTTKDNPLPEPMAIFMNVLNELHPGQRLYDRLRNDGPFSSRYVAAANALSGSNLKLVDYLRKAQSMRPVPEPAPVQSKAGAYGYCYRDERGRSSGMLSSPPRR